MKKYWKQLMILLVIIILTIVSISIWNKLEYFTPNPIIPHKKVSLILPYSSINEATSMIPMGETIAHNFYGGHPGIDFQWDHSIPLIAVGDGKITDIVNADDMGKPVLYLTLNLGDYTVIYKELDKTASGITKNSLVHKGDVVGYPHCEPHSENGLQHTGCQVHWEFGYNMLSIGFERLCPLTYFDIESRTRIEKLWGSVSVNDRFKQNAPHICSNIYYNRDQ